MFTHGDLQITHVFVDGDEITGVIDWSEAGHGDALYDLATLTLGHEEHLGDVVAGYGTDLDLDLIRAWWSWRSLGAARWLIEHGFDPSPVARHERRAGDGLFCSECREHQRVRMAGNRSALITVPPQ